MAWEKSYEPAFGLPRNLRPVIPDATSQNLGWVGLQAFRCRNSASNEVHWPPLSRHLLVLMTRPPAKMRFRYAGGKRDLPSPAGSIAVIPGTREPQSGRGRDRCRLLRPKPALFSLQKDRWPHPRAISGLGKKRLKSKSEQVPLRHGEAIYLG